MELGKINYFFIDNLFQESHNAAHINDSHSRCWEFLLQQQQIQ